MHYLLAVILACSAVSANAGTDNALTVFVSIPPQKYLVERIGGERVLVYVMLKPGQTPETYDPAPKQIALLAKAQVYFRIGVPFEHHWMNTVTAQNREMLVVNCCTQLLKAGDPHTWTDPGNMKYMAGQILDTLTSRDPAGGAAYTANHAALIADLDRMDLDIQTLLKTRRTDYFIVSHSGWRYYAERYGLKQMALDDYGREKGPRGLAEMVELARREGLRTVFIQLGHPTGTAYTLAKELGAQAVPIDNLAENYIENLYQISRLIAGAVR